MLHRLAALLLAIAICILNPFAASAQESAFIDITEKPQYSLEVLCDLPSSRDLQIEISYRGEIPSVAFITPSGGMCEVNRMNWSYADGVISVKITDAEVGCWYVKTLAEDKDRLSIKCQNAIVHSDKTARKPIAIVLLLLLLVCVFMIFTRRRMQHHLRDISDLNRSDKPGDD